MLRLPTRIFNFANLHKRNFYVSCVKWNYYDILGVKKDATLEEIRSSFIRKSKDLHPDLPSNNGKDTHLEFIEVVEAHAVLSRSELRTEYDLELSEPSNGVAGQHIKNPYRSPDYQSPYQEYNAAWQEADRWTDYHNTYGTSRAKRVAQRDQKQPFWQNYFNFKLHHGGGGPGFANHEPLKKHRLQKGYKFLVAMVVILTGVCISFVFYTDNGHIDMEKMRKLRTLQQIYRRYYDYSTGRHS